MIQTTDGVLVPKGVRLKFVNGVAKYQGHPIKRELLPLECIVGAKGPFLNACCATVLNHNAKFQAEHKFDYKDWMHFIVHGNALIVYIWDTREVVDVIIGVHDAVTGKPITRTLVNKDTGKRITQFLGQPRFGWAKSVYEVVLRGIEHRPDNGLPLKTNNHEWQDIIDKFNHPIEVKYAYESIDELNEDAMSAKADSEKNNAVKTKTGWTMPNGSYPINNADDIQDAANLVGNSKDYSYAEVKNYIIYCARHLNCLDKLPKSWLDEMAASGQTFAKKIANEAVIGPKGREVMVMRFSPGVMNTLRQKKLKFVKSEPWLHLAIAWHSAKPCYAIYIWDTRKVFCQGYLSKEDAYDIVKWCMHDESAIDNGRPLDGTGPEIQEMNRSFIAKANEAGEAFSIVPAKDLANTHIVLFDEHEVARITAQDLRLAHYGDDSQFDDLNEDDTDEKDTDADETKDSSDNADNEEHTEKEADKANPKEDEEAKPVQLPAYANVGKCKLTVTDNEGNILDLPCLKNDIVTEKELLDDLAKHFKY